MNPRLVGRCGIYCGFCEIHRASRDYIGLRVELAERYHCRPGDVACDGCQAVHARGWAMEPEWGKNCRILECLADQGLKFCYECPSLGACKTWKELAQSYLKLGISLRENLEILKQGKTREWLTEQETKWRCPDCSSKRVVSKGLLVCPRCDIAPPQL